MRKTKKEIMAGVDCISSKIVANNTIEYQRADGATVYRLHLTDIVTKRKDGSVILNSAGWQTVTTKERMNRYLPAGWHIYQEKNVWYLRHVRSIYKATNESFVYKDGIIIRPDGSVDNAGPSIEYIKKLQGKINNYVKGFMCKLVKRELDGPGPGDCWSCKFFGSKDDHVLSHIDEKYYTASLLERAIEELPVSQMAMHCLGYWWQIHDQRFESMESIARRQISSSLKRYLNRCLGLAS